MAAIPFAAAYIPEITVEPSSLYRYALHASFAVGPVAFPRRNPDIMGDSRLRRAVLTPEPPHGHSGTPEKEQALCHMDRAWQTRRSSPFNRLGCVEFWLAACISCRAAAHSATMTPQESAREQGDHSPRGIGQPARD